MSQAPFFVQRRTRPRAASPLGLAACCNLHQLNKPSPQALSVNKNSVRTGDPSRPDSDRYALSFTTGGLFHRESVKLAQLYLNLGDWDSVRDQVVADNLLQARTLNTLKRVCREIVSRLRVLCSEELNFLVEGSPQDQAYLLWLAVCRRYRFIGDFAVEVLRERYITLKTDLSYEDFDSFFNQKSEWHLELDKISPVTRNKLRQVLFKILREADLLTPNNMVNAAMLSPGLLNVVLQHSRNDVLFFPAFESDLKGMAQ